MESNGIDSKWNGMETEWNGIESNRMASNGMMASTRMLECLREDAVTLERARDARREQRPRGPPDACIMTPP